MKYLLFLLSIVSGDAAMSQFKQLDPKSDTSFWFQLKQLDAHHIGLTNLTTSSDSLHFRFWMENQAIDIWTNDYKTFYGILSNHTESVEDNSNNKRKSHSKYYSDKINLTSADAKKIYDLFNQAQFFQIPTDKQIKNWAQGFDGFEYLAEYSTRNIYSFKTYWTPSAQNGVSEADTITHLNKKLESILHMKSIWDNFLNSLPSGFYKEGEILGVYIPPPKKEMAPDEIFH